MRHFVRFYEFLLQVSCFEDTDLHKKYNFISYLLAYINIKHLGVAITLTKKSKRPTLCRRKPRNTPLHSSNMYQIFTYVKNKDTEFGDKPHKVSGMLLYAATDEAIQPDNSYQMSGNKISVKTLDLNRDFSEIAAQLNAIVDEHFRVEA